MDIGFQKVDISTDGQKYPLDRVDIRVLGVIWGYLPHIYGNSNCWDFTPSEGSTLRNREIYDRVKNIGTPGG